MEKSKFTLKQLKDRFENGELDLALSTLAEDDIPFKEMKQLRKLTALDLSCNVLTTLPTQLCDMTQLVKLDISKNLLTCLPEEIGNLVNLSHLDLLGNKLTTLPESFGNLKALRWLDLKDNPLSAPIIKEAGDCLDEEQCRRCAKKVVALMAYVHQEREIIRAEEKSKADIELKKQQEEEKQRKKLEKQQEKERKRQKFLAEQQAVRQEAQPIRREAGDETVEEQLIESSQETSQAETGVSEGISAIAILFMSLAVVFSVCLGVYFYCEQPSADLPACQMPVVVEIRRIISQTFGPMMKELSKKVSEILEASSKTVKT